MPASLQFVPGSIHPCEEHPMRKIQSVAFLLVLATACSDMSGPSGSDGQTGEASLIVMNALHSGRTASLRLDGARLSLPTSGSSLHQAITAGPHRLEVNGPDGAVLGTHDFTVSTGLRRTVVLGEGLDAIVALLGATMDTAAVPLPDAVRVRFVHTVEGVEPADGYLQSLVSSVHDSTNGRFVSPFAFGVGSDAMFPGYAVRPPGVFRVAAISRAQPARVLAEETVSLSAGDVASLVLVRGVDGALVWRLVKE